MSRFGVPCKHVALILAVRVKAASYDTQNNDGCLTSPLLHPLNSHEHRRLERLFTLALDLSDTKRT